MTLAAGASSVQHSPLRSNRSSTCAAQRIATMSAITTCPKPLRSGGLTGGPSCSRQAHAEATVRSGIGQLPVDGHPAVGHRQRAVFGGVGGKLVQGQRQAVHGVGTQVDLGTPHLDACRDVLGERGHLRAHQIGIASRPPSCARPADPGRAPWHAGARQSVSGTRSCCRCSAPSARRSPAPPPAGSWSDAPARASGTRYASRAPCARRCRARSRRCRRGGRLRRTSAPR